MNIKAFIDPGFSHPLDFSIHLLRSCEFLSQTLNKFASYGSDKESMASSVASNLNNGSIRSEDILLEYFKQPRQWFSYKIGKYSTIPKLDNPKILLNEFGQEKWYGPIFCDDYDSYFYIRTYRFAHYSESDSGDNNDDENQIIEDKIRWSIIAKVAQTNISFYWNGFSTNQQTRINSHSQFPFWRYIPKAIMELETKIKGKYDYPLVNKIVLNHMWNKYIGSSEYTWRHLAVRAEASGVNLCARSKGIKEISVEGLLALAKKIAKSVCSDLFLKVNLNTIEKVNLLSIAENSVLKTLIHEWGTKSYEFSLDCDSKKIFKAHCYFGLKPDSKTQDCFPHFKSFQSYGGPYNALDFLLTESRMK